MGTVSLHSSGMIADTEPGEGERRSGSAGRGVAVMVAWYGAALLPLAVWLGPQLAQPRPEPFRPCTAKTLACWEWSASDTIAYVVLPVLLACLVVSCVMLAVMLRRGSRAMAAGTAAALTGWVMGPCAVLLLLVLWGVLLLVITGHSW